MIYRTPDQNEPIDQADIIDDCPILAIKEYDCDGLNSPRIDVARSRVLVLTQTCDLANGKVSTATVAIVHDAQFLVDQGLIKSSDVRGPIRTGRVFGWYYLPKDGNQGLPEMVVDLRQLHTVRLDLLAQLCQRGCRPGRLLSPYREHLAKHFGDTFSRIGLPEPYLTD